MAEQVRVEPVGVGVEGGQHGLGVADSPGPPVADGQGGQPPEQRGDDSGGSESVSVSQYEYWKHTGRADPLQARRKEGPRIGLWDLWLWRAAVPLITVRVLTGAQCGAYLRRRA